MIFIPLIFILAYAIIIATIFDTSFCKSLPTGIFTMTAIVYVSGFANNLMFGLYLVVVIFLVFCALVVCNYNNYRERVKCKLIDRNIVLFIALYLIIIW